MTSTLKKMTDYFSRTQEFLTFARESDHMDRKEGPKDSGKSVSLAILFADIARNRNFYQTLGDKNARKLISACLGIISNVAERHKGKHIKTSGDQLMCAFATANEAVNAAREMHLAVEKKVSENPGLVLPNIRVGIHTGQALMQEGEVLGEAVRVAVRMMGLAKERQIITTKQTVDALRPEFQKMSKCIDRTTIRSKSGSLNIHELMWEPDQTAEIENAFVSGTLHSFNAHLELRFRNQIIDVNRNRSTLTMGREHFNDVTLNSKRISRSHACIEYRRGRFVLIDRSTNGTYLLINGKPPMKVRRFETPLYGGGIIGLAQKVNHDSPNAIHFIVKP